MSLSAPQQDTHAHDDVSDALPSFRGELVREEPIAVAELMRKHSTLDQCDLEALLARLAPARDQAGEKYEAIRQTLTRYFEWRHCLPADEHVDETIDRVARRLRSGEQIRSANPYPYFHGVAKRVCQESLRHRLREVQPQLAGAATADNASPSLACLAHCLDALPLDARELLEAYYLDARGELPRQLGITPNALRLRVFSETETQELRRELLEAETPLTSPHTGTVWMQSATVRQKYLVTKPPLRDRHALVGTAPYSTVSLQLSGRLRSQGGRMDRRTRVSIVLFVFAATSAGFAQSGFFRYSGGPVKAKAAATQTAPTTFSEGGWFGLPNAVLQSTVPTGTTDVFNVSFSAECRLFGAGVGDYVRIRIVDTVTVGGAFVSRTNLEPYDADQAFCSADGYATHKGNWVHRAGQGVHTLVVQFMLADALPDDDLSAWIDDWTFELVVHE